MRAGEMKPQANVLFDLVSEAARLSVDASRFLSRQARGGLARLASRRLDALIALALGAGAAAVAVATFYRLRFDILFTVYNSWFDADLIRVMTSSLGRWESDHYRTTVHPLFSLFVSLPLNVIRKLGLGPQEVAALQVGAGALALTSAFYAAARTFGLPRLDAGLAVLLLLSTSASVFWLVVPETYALGAATMLVSLVWLGTRRGEHDVWSAPLQSLLSVSMTASNWMAGMIAAVIGLGVRRAISVIVLTFAILSALTVVQQMLFPQSGRLFDFSEEWTYLVANACNVLPDPETGVERALAFVGQPFLAPAPTIAYGYQGWPGVVFATAFPTEWRLSTATAAAGWVALLVLGGVGLSRAPQPLRLFLLALIAAQCALHSVYGHMLFLYSLHFTPLLALVAALACRTRWRLAALALMAVTTLAGLLHNQAQLRDAIELLAALESFPRPGGP